VLQHQSELNAKKKMESFEYKNLISNLASQKARKFLNKKYNINIKKILFIILI
jgi:hypothetical protein